MTINQKLKKLNDKKFFKWWPCLKAAIADTFWEYTRYTRVSGIWMLRRHRSHGVTRWCWSLVIITLFLCGVFLSLKLWQKFYSYPILNTISNDLLITDVAFPGITICSPKVVNVEKVRRFIKTLDIPEKYDIEEVIAGFEYINAFTAQNWSPPKNDHKSYKATDAVLRLNNVTIYEAAMQVCATCDDFVKRCFWGGLEFPCRHNTEHPSFIRTTSFLGPCCSFNYNPRNLSYIPYSSDVFGIYGGLTFIGVEGSESNISTGLIVLIHHPMDYVTESTTSVTITPNSESFVEITPTVQSSAKEVLEFSERKRDCLISDDLALIRYRQASCLVACHSQLIMEKCKCHPYHLPYLEAQHECKLSNSQCYTNEFGSFNSIKCDQCLPNCYDVTYSTMSYKTDLLLHNYSFSPLYSMTNYTNDTFIVRAYLAKQVVAVIHKVTVMSWIGLLSDLGGVFNLCLGLSIISVVEFFYYIIYRLSVNYRARQVLMQ